MDKVYSIKEIRDIINEQKAFLSEKYFVDSFMLFGSYAKNLQNQNSDIDLLVNFSKPIDMFDFIDLQEYLADLFGKKIDLGTLNGLKPFIKNSILEDAVVL